ncbi:peptidoglycan-binding protein [Streptomyces sp. NPDC005970]|uniref:peptidoglycan-binding protein n=1 Tax=Streptomyces sp. NPDC005970 TaxID=3156723 RepID=UPI0033D4277E
MAGHDKTQQKPQNQTKRQKLDALHKHVRSLKFEDTGFAAIGFCSDLSDAIGKARDTPVPFGDPDHIDGVAASYTRAAELLESAQGDLGKVAKAGLPAVWVGTAGEKASEVVGAASRTTDETAEKLREAVPVLRQLAIDIGAAQATDEYARVALDYGKSLCGMFSDREQLLEAKKATLDGITYLMEADDRAKEGGKKAADKLNKLAAQARTRKVTAGGLTDADRLVIADAADPGGPADLNEILSANELKRSAQFRDKMSAQDQAEFDRLISRAKSPQESAYLMKALAAGYDIKTLRSFGEDIQGRDATWLREHLAPFHTSGDTRVGLELASEFDVPGSKGAVWMQPDKSGTCVASSTVTARALVDPVYTLRLTTGGHPGDPAYDSPAAFKKRLLDEQTRVHKEGDGGPLPDGGMDLIGKNKVINDEIAPHTGSSYEQREVRTADSRRAALPLIEQAVDEGKPVPIGVQGFDTVDGERVPVGHAMMIVGHEGDKLEVYNPWGFTTWISEDDFINNHMDKASDKRLPDAYEYSLPK